MSYSQKKKYPKNQLYYHLRNISGMIEYDHNRDLIISYSIFEALKDFSSNSGDRQEVRFQEIKRVYDSLKDISDSVSLEDKQEGVFEAELHSKVEKYLRSDDPESKSSLYNRLVDMVNSKKKNHVDLLRRNGEDLFNIVHQRGPLRRKIDYLTKDYIAIEEAFEIKEAKDAR